MRPRHLLHRVFDSLVKVTICPITSQSSLMRHATSQSSPMRHATSQSSPMRHVTCQSSPMRHVTSQSSPMRHVTSQSSPMRHATSQSSPMRHTTSHRLYRVMSRHLTLSACLCHFNCHSLSASLRAESVRSTGSTGIDSS